MDYMGQEKIYTRNDKYPYVVNRVYGFIDEWYFPRGAPDSGDSWPCRVTGLRSVIVRTWWYCKSPNVVIGVTKRLRHKKSEFLKFSVMPPVKLVAGKSFLSAKQTELIIKWIVLNQQIIIDYWNRDDYSTFVFMKRMKKV